MKPYYYVFRIGASHPPTFKHMDANSAVAEAERLVMLHPGATFEVLKCIAKSQIVKPSVTFWMDGEGPAEITGLRQQSDI